MLDPLSAERQLLAIQAAVWADMKDRDRAEAMGRIRRKLDGAPAKPKTKQEMLDALAASGMSVVRRPARKTAGRARTRRRGKA